MQLMKWMLFFALILTGTSALAAKADCVAATWPYDRNQPGSDNQKLFLLNERPKLEAFFIGELTEEKLSQSGVSYDLARFLIDTEQNKKKKAFYEVLRWGSDLTDRKSQPKRMKLEKVCEIREKLLK
jgi:hypothetical protein